jgi:hypothetical protein
MENKENSDSDWETEEEDYFQLKIENISFIKTKLNNIGRVSNWKYKKFEKDTENKIYNRSKYLNESIYNHISLLQPQTNKLKNQEKEKEKDKDKENVINKDSDSIENKDDLNHLIIDQDVYNIRKKPQIGSLMLLEIKYPLDKENFNQNLNENFKEKDNSNVKGINKIKI